MFQEKPQAFLALPVNDAASKALAEQIGQTIRQQGIETMLVTDVGSDGVLSDQIQSAIRRAEFVVADLTGANPNVLFEVGMAFGLNKPMLLLSQASTKEMPFDVKTHQVAMYRPDDVGAVLRYVELWLRDVRARREATAY